MNIENILQIPKFYETGTKNPVTAALVKQKARLLTQYPAPDYSLRRDISHGINKFANLYSGMTRGYSILLRPKELNKPDIEIPIYNRFSPEYQEKQISKINRLHWKRPPQFFITLTVDFHKYASIYEGYKEMSKEWNRLISHIKKYDKHPEFLKIFEIQEKNTKNIHIHALLQSTISLERLQEIVSYLHIGTQEDVRDLSKYYEMKNGKLPSNHELYYMGIKYILKYIKKGIYSDIETVNETRNILWALGARTFSFSRSLLTRLTQWATLDLTFKTNSNPGLGFLIYSYPKKVLSWLLFTFLEEQKQFIFLGLRKS